MRQILIIMTAMLMAFCSKESAISAQPGDVILYNGSNICIFYGSNSWSYTRLGKIDGLTGNELSTFLKAGQSNISVTLSLTSDVTAINDIHHLQDQNEFYSLSGIKVEHPSNDIYIRNGKKVAL